MKISILLVTMLFLVGCNSVDFKNQVPQVPIIPYIHPCQPLADTNPLPHASAISLAFGSAALANSHSAWPRVSSTNKIVTFYSFATNLVNPATTNLQAYYFNRETETVHTVAATAGGVRTNGTSLMPEGNCTGKYIAFITTGTNLTADVLSGTYHHLFLKDLTSGEIKLVSASAAGVPGNATSGFDGYFPHVSYDGRYVSFISNATNLVSSPTVTGPQIYRKDMQTGEVKLVSSNDSGDFPAGTMAHFDMSFDGKLFVMSIISPNFPDANGFRQVYLKDLENNTLTLLSKFNNLVGNNFSTHPIFSGNGEYVFFYSGATNLTDPVISHAPVSGSHFRLKLSDYSIEHIGKGTTACCDRPASASFDGNIFAWLSNQAQGTVPAGTSVVVVKNMTTGEVKLVSSDALGVRLSNRSEIFSMAANGKYVVYQGLGTNIFPGDPSVGSWQAYVGVTGF